MRVCCPARCPRAKPPAIVRALLLLLWARAKFGAAHSTVTCATPVGAAAAAEISLERHARWSPVAALMQRFFNRCRYR